MTKPRTTVAKPPARGRQYVFCVRNGDYVDLQVRRVYLSVADKTAANDGMLRVVDDSGEDYLYPSDFFVPVELPSQAKRAFVN